MKNRYRPLGLAALVLMAAAACGAPTDSAPRALDAEEVPFDLLVADPVTTTTTVAARGTTSTVTLFFMGEDHLVPVERQVSAPASVEKVLKALVTGPRDDEVARGLRTAINPGATVLTAPVEEGVATVDISGAYFLGTGEDQIVALAQTVFTATSLGNVVAVRFTLNGQRVEVPIGEGQRISTPVGRAAYARYASPQ